MSFRETTLYFLKMRNQFTFSGGEIECEILYDKNGVDWFKGFRLYDERGKRKITTKHPETLHRLIKSKSSLTFQIKQWAEARAEGTLPLVEFSKRLTKEKYPMADTNGITTINWENGEPRHYDDIETMYQLPSWVINAVEAQKHKH